MTKVTENYIKMCEKAEEIQKLCQYKMGDWFNGKYGLVVLDVDFKDEYIGDNWVTRNSMIEDTKEDEGFWLPMQEQLFAMVNFDKLLTFEFSSHKETRTLYIMRTDGTCSLYKDDNFKGCILQYVMYEKYNKEWLPKEQKWVSANE